MQKVYSNADNLNAYITSIPLLFLSLHGCKFKEGHFRLTLCRVSPSGRVQYSVPGLRFRPRVVRSLFEDSRARACVPCCRYRKFRYPIPTWQFILSQLTTHSRGTSATTCLRSLSIPLHWSSPIPHLLSLGSLSLSYHTFPSAYWRLLS